MTILLNDNDLFERHIILDEGRSLIMKVRELNISVIEMKEQDKLISIFDLSNLNTIKVTHMENLFYDCSTLISIKDISKLKTNSVINMRGIFIGSISLKSIPDISIWDTHNTTDITCLFSKYSKLSSLPDI